MKQLEERGTLDGLEVAITGKLASMNRDEAVRRIADAGGHYAAEPTETTAILVVGFAVLPLAEDGRPTQSLRAARELRERGTGIEILTEEQWLQRLGLDGSPTDLQRLYTTVQLSRILGVPTRVIRAWVRHGLIRPAREVNRLSFFEFRQVSAARTLAELSARGVSPARIRRSLEQLGHWMPEGDRSLAQLETLEGGGQLLVRLEEGQLAEPSGQLRLDFDGALPRPAPAAPKLQPERTRAEAWFEAGVIAEEEGRYAAAALAYEKTLEAGEVRAEVCFNLGNALYALDKKQAAADRFAQATEMEPDYVEAWNNLGNALSDLGRTREAVSAYRRALSIEPDYADAHFNLAEALALLGDRPAAQRHWRAYLFHDPNSSWAEQVRERLEQDEPDDD